MNRRLPSSPILMMLAVALIGLATLATGWAQLEKFFSRNRIAEDLSNMRQVYLMLSSFTHDNDGAFPNEESAVFYLEKQPAPTSSNDYFRQLIVGTGFDDVEELFWIKRASVCNNVPPDKMTSWHGKHGLSRILGRGECGIAYTLNQTMQSNPERILMLSAYKAGTTDFDPGLYGAKESGGQILVTRIDGSAKALNLRNGRPLDETGADLLKDATCWGGTPPVIAQPVAAVKTWTDRVTGRKVEAEFVSLEDGKVILQTSDGKDTAPIPLENLSDTLREIARELASARGINPNQPAQEELNSMSAEQRAQVQLRVVQWDLEETLGKIEELKHKNEALRVTFEYERTDLESLERVRANLEEK